MNELQVSCDGQRYSFEQDQTVRIGRSTDNDVVVSDPTVSRQHARMAWSPDGWLYEGLGRAGTFVRGNAVASLLVAEPVELALASPHGPVVRLEPSPPASPAVPPAAAGHVMPAPAAGHVVPPSAAWPSAAARGRRPGRAVAPGGLGRWCAGPRRGPGRSPPDRGDGAQPGPPAARRGRRGQG